MSDLIRLENVSFAYDKRLILQNVNLIIPKGKITALMGTSGCGKTTLLRLISGQKLASIGKVLVFDKNIAELNLKQLYTIRQKVGMLFQFGALFTDLSVFENVAFPLREHVKIPEKIIHDVVLMKLNSVGLRGARDLMPSEISGGMARRVALARAIALDPELLLYDEPFTGLDPVSLGVIARLIKTLNNVLNSTSILVSHDIKSTFEIADYVVIISEGKIIEQGSIEEIINSENDFVQRFISARPHGAFHYPAKTLEEDFYT